ncbi:MAG: phosphoribosylaminoimidazolesuccinocarboxamide synthase [Candidatus Woykebacteria bacterium RBG_13_40_7b]|uniref:Phosphoribosylaminoimidazole-succinocarboxamide synthase n=1 Tax=Candidatus Woykebacteria bacterium RBG_13_40_7b TaxID=1802594 RepID=A0A1G1W9L8_9BACT|nr:MAG: phosphoribosylaminoimidazolesuccinocarboxamide synthase [Candidatus Woykebacteria bacterium RBG_13_40_7b]
MKEVLRVTNLPLPLYARGKVRDTYKLNDDLLLMIGTDRVSTFDVVHPTGIPNKGKILTQLSDFWFSIQEIKNVVKNHFVELVDEKWLEKNNLRDHKELIGRSMVVKKAKRVDVECVVRGYITGSAWKDYLDQSGPEQGATICGIKFPPGLKESEKLSTPFFTPTTKALSGHDQNITVGDLVKILGKKLADELIEKSTKLYQVASNYALKKGSIIIADTKFEFGFLEGNLVLIDEIFTPDSSRFWDAGDYEVGRAQNPLDKQHVRNYGIKIGWDRKPPAPELPKEIVEATQAKYLDVFRRLTGSDPI